MKASGGAGVVAYWVKPSFVILASCVRELVWLQVHLLPIQPPADVHGKAVGMVPCHWHRNPGRVPVSLLLPFWALAVAAIWRMNQSTEDFFSPFSPLLPSLSLCLSNEWEVNEWIDIKKNEAWGFSGWASFWMRIFQGKSPTLSSVKGLGRWWRIEPVEWPSALSIWFWKCLVPEADENSLGRMIGKLSAF